MKNRFDTYYSRSKGWTDDLLLEKYLHLMGEEEDFFLQKTTGSYYEEIDGVTFVKWSKEHLILNIPANYCG